MPKPSSARAATRPPVHRAPVANATLPATVKRDREQHALARAEAVERHAERQLGGGENEEIDAGQQADLDRRQADLGGEIRRDHADRIAQELADDVEQPQASPRPRCASAENGLTSARRRAGCLRSAVSLVIPGRSPGSRLTGPPALAISAETADYWMPRCRRRLTSAQTARMTAIDFTAFVDKLAAAAGDADPAVLPHLAERREQEPRAAASIRSPPPTAPPSRRCAR